MRLNIKKPYSERRDAKNKKRQLMCSSQVDNFVSKKETAIKNRNTIFTLFVKLIFISVQRSEYPELNLYKIILQNGNFLGHAHVIFFPYLTRVEWIYIFALM